MQGFVRRLGLAALISLIAANVVADPVNPALLRGLSWRCIGPFRGGRVSSISGAIGVPGTFYMGMPDGGIWKTTSNGTTWYPVGDSIKDVSCFGSIAVAPSNPNVIYAGSGEAIGGEGNGIYKSSDAGSTWEHLGLDDTHQIPAILVDPHNADVVVVAALGNARKDTDARGVFRSEDGGKTWTKTLFIDNQTGVQHIASAYDNPNVIFAFARRYRNGTPGAANPQANNPQNSENTLYKSTDEGRTWTKLSTDGLPKLTGRCTLAVAQNTNSQRVFMIGQFGLARSDDGGATWKQVAKDDSRIANGQGNYTSAVYVDPKNPDVVYTLATCVYRSTDGGNTFEGFKGAPGGDDPHDLWIDPTDGNRILLGGDQGASVSVDGGKTWGLWYNQPTAQVYHITTDNQFPYWVYATQQDSGTVGTASRGNLGEITNLDWAPHPGFEFGSMVVDPLNPKISYVEGYNVRLAKVTNPSGQWIEIGPEIDPNLKLHSGFNFPMVFSPSNPHELMIGYNKLMATTDGGLHWNALSPDLGISKEDKPSTGGFSPAIEAISPSTVSPGTIWCGTGNGKIWLTKDHGANWEEVSIPAAKQGGIPCIDASHTNPAAAYAVAFIRNDSGPHLYRTRDYGKTWTEIIHGLPTESASGAGANVIRCDTKKDGLLFAGTQSAMYFSTDDGDNWQSLMLNLPNTIYNDINVHGNDLVIGTYGRGLWILDDFSVLRQVDNKTLADAAHLYKPGEAIRIRHNTNLDTPMPPEVPHAANPPDGAVICYSLAAKPQSDVRIEISDSSGRVVRHMSSAPIKPFDDPPPAVATYWVLQRKPLPTEIGVNRVVWDCRYDDPPSFLHDAQDVMQANPGETPQAVPGPLVLPGVYTVKLFVDGNTYTQTVNVKNDPRSPATFADLKSQHELAMRYYNAIQQGWDAYQQVADMRASVGALMSTKPSDEISKEAKALDDKLAAIGGKVVYARKFYGAPPPTSYVGLNEGLLVNLTAVDTGDFPATEPLMMAYGAMWSKLKAVNDNWRTICAKDVPAFNALLAKNGLKALSTPTALADAESPGERFLPKPEAKSKPATAKANMSREEYEHLIEGGGD